MNLPSFIILIILIYIMCKFHASTTFHWIGFFLPKVSLPECRFLPKCALESLPKCFTCLIWYISIVKMDIFAQPTLTKMAVPKSTMFSYCFFSALKDPISHVNEIHGDVALRCNGGCCRSASQKHDKEALLIVCYHSMQHLITRRFYILTVS